MQIPLTVSLHHEERPFAPTLWFLSFNKLFICTQTFPLVTRLLFFPKAFGEHLAASLWEIQVASIGGFFLFNFCWHFQRTEGLRAGCSSIKAIMIISWQKWLLLLQPWKFSWCNDNEGNPAPIKWTIFRMTYYPALISRGNRPGQEASRIHEKVG